MEIQKAKASEMDIQKAKASGMDIQKGKASEMDILKTKASEMDNQKGKASEMERQVVGVRETRGGPLPTCNSLGRRRKMSGRMYYTSGPFQNCSTLQGWFLG